MFAGLLFMLVIPNGFEILFLNCCRYGSPHAGRFFAVISKRLFTIRRSNCESVNHLVYVLAVYVSNVISWLKSADRDWCCGIGSFLQIAFNLKPCPDLHQFPIHVLQLPPFRHELVAALRALRLARGHTAETRRADLHARGLLPVLLRRALQRPLPLLQVVAQPQGVPNVIEDHSGLAGLRAQAAADHLQVQAHRLRGPQQDAAGHARHVHTLADQGAAG